MSIKKLDVNKESAQAPATASSSIIAGKKSAPALVATACTTEGSGATTTKVSRSKGSSVTPLPAVADALKLKHGQAVINSTGAVSAAANARVSPASPKKHHATGKASSVKNDRRQKISAIAEEEDAVAAPAAVVKVLPTSVKVK
jgi:hypothetical protein